jgi:hypothetical protein
MASLLWSDNLIALTYSLLCRLRTTTGTPSSSTWTLTLTTFKRQTNSIRGTSTSTALKTSGSVTLASSSGTIQRSLHITFTVVLSCFAALSSSANSASQIIGAGMSGKPVVALTVMDCIGLMEPLITTSSTSFPQSYGRSFLIYGAFTCQLRIYNQIWTS